MNKEEHVSQPKYRSAYRAPEFWIDRVELAFDLQEDHTEVHAALTVRRNCGTGPLVLQGGRDLALQTIALNGTALAESEYCQDAETLTVFAPPSGDAPFVLETTVTLRPQDNTALEGLYLSNGMLCTQCEPEGFRQITFFIDRPDVMAEFITTITADRTKYPVLLSNGNRVAHETLPDGRHRARWHDPFRKPAYLFALVAGNLRCRQGEYLTRSGRKVDLEFWVAAENLDKCDHALHSLQKAMRWDEEVYGLEYDLSVYMVVAVHDYNMGAMENKGLNIFNTKYILARPDTATDEDYEQIEGVIGHEYFHNWTGNRVTCRDWFQLTLKEGLTVFRDECFSADMNSAAVTRIRNVNTLRLKQFAEDEGSMAHPIRPESYFEINNFYTATVYNKGSEVIRMMHTLLGASGFRRGMDLYFQRHDGQAVTCDDFRAAMADANHTDLSQFALWYSQFGTPRIQAEGRYDAASQTYTLTLRQSGPQQNNQPFQAMHIPVRMGLLAPDGQPVALELFGEPAPAQPVLERVLELRQAEQDFCFVRVPAPPTPSLFRDFSAPIHLEPLPQAELLLLAKHDRNPFNRWDALQTLARSALLALAEDWRAGRALHLDSGLVEAMAAIAQDRTLDGASQALTLALPEEALLAQYQHPVDPAALHAARMFMTAELARQLQPLWLSVYQTNQTGVYQYNQAHNAKRALKNLALRYLVASGSEAGLALARQQFDNADNMTDSEAALTALIETQSPHRNAVLALFYQRWHHDPLVMDKWFRWQAESHHPQTYERAMELAVHPDFNLFNPNRARALLFSFSQGNPFHFHRDDGAGYAFLVDHILRLDSHNPQTAARLTSVFNAWQKYQPPQRDAMGAQLQRLAAHPGLSKDTAEIVHKNLA